MAFSPRVLQLLGSKYFAVQRRFLNILGMELTETELELNYPLWLGVLIFAIPCHNWPMMVDSLLNLDDLMRFTDCFATIMQGTITTFKLLILVYKRRELGKLVLRVHSVNLKAAEVSTEQQQLLLQQNEWNAHLCQRFKIPCYGTIVASGLMPIVHALIEYYQTGIFQPYPPLKFCFWLDESNPFYFWPVYFWSVLAVSSVTWGLLAVDTIFFWLIHNVVAQFQIVRLKLSTGDSSKQHLVQCVNQHSLALELADRVSELYAEIMFVEYTLSYLLLCSLAYHFSAGGWTPEVPFQAGFLAIVLSQLCAYCFSGEYIKEQSTYVADDIYSSFDWSEMPLPSRRLLLLMTMRAQKPSQVSGYMFNIDRPLLLWVMRTTGSFLAMLRTLEH